jgi:hypothetical protein
MRKPQWVRSPALTLLLLVAPANAQEPAARGADAPAELVSLETFAFPEGRTLAATPVSAAPEPEHPPFDAAGVPAAGSWRRSTALRHQWRGPASTALEAHLGALEVGTPLGAPDDRGASWARDAVVDLGVSLESGDARIRVATRYGVSRREPQAWADRLALELAGAVDPPRPLDEALGHAVLGRIDIDLWKGDALRVLGFGSYRRTGPLFPGVHGLRGLEPSDRSALEGGVDLDAGPVSLELARESREIGLSRRGKAGSSRAERVRAQVAIDLESVRRGIAVPRDAAWLLPDGVWLRASSGREWKGGAISGRSDAIADLSAGFGWTGSDSAVTLAFWRSVSGAHVPFGDGAQWSGTGARLDGEISRGVWTLSGAAGLRRDSSTCGTGRLAGDLHASLWLGVAPSRRTRVSASVGFGVDPDVTPLDASTRRFALDAVVDLGDLPPEGSAPARLRAVYDLGFRGLTGVPEEASHTLRTALEIGF